MRRASWPYGVARWKLVQACGFYGSRRALFAAAPPTVVFDTTPAIPIWEINPKLEEEVSNRLRKVDSEDRIITPG